MVRELKTLFKIYIRLAADRLPILILPFNEGGKNTFVVHIKSDHSGGAGEQGGPGKLVFINNRMAGDPPDFSSKQCGLLGNIYILKVLSHGN